VARSIGRWMNSVWTELRECQCWPLGELGLDRVGWVPMLAPGWTRSGPSCVSANVGHWVGTWFWNELNRCQRWPLAGCSFALTRSGNSP